jgi:pimeloyl-ACP methyl ester carboxylesterase
MSTLTSALRLLIMCLLLGAALAGPAAAATCPYQARCGSITVPLDHTGATPGTIPIGYSILPATGPKTGTIFFLSGGPGESAVVYTSLVRKELAPLRASHDIVLVDQRGTGRSGAVDCESVRTVQACAKRLGAKRAFLTTVETAKDLEDLRVALGVPAITPLGVSYGTKVANEYARRFPATTASVILDSAVGIEPIDFDALGGIAAMPRIMREVCADGPCAQTVKDAGAALFAAVKRVRAGNVRVTLGGFSSRVRERDLFLIMRMSDFDPLLRADLPAALSSLARGDGAPLVHLVDRMDDVNDFSVLRGGVQSDEDGAYSASRFLATACVEGQLPWSPASAPSTRRAATKAYLARLGSRPFAPFKPSIVNAAGAAPECLKWPSTPVPEPAPATAPDVPVLVISGRDDIRTPLEGAQAVAAAYPRATVLAVPHVGHSVLTTDKTKCALDGAAAFLAGQPVAPCTGQPLVPAGRYYPATFNGTAAKGAEQTVAAVRHDLEAATAGERKGTRFTLPGVRGGLTLTRRGALDLRNVKLFANLRVSGKLSAKGNGTLTVRGSRTATVAMRGFATGR